ncbi:MAG: hypothetical protein H7A46_11340 [Verrucomicrobiales bacterium]|nr:hypothetical protein [Verrucomicrobiales bacterium]
MNSSRITTGLILLFWAALGCTLGHAQNHVLVISKTEVENNNFATGVIEQKGGAARIAMPGRLNGASATLAFWIKRNIPADQQSSRGKDASRDVLISGVAASNDTIGLNVPLSIVPDDAIWHFVHARFDPQLPVTGQNNGTMDVKVYIDGELKFTGVHGLFDLQSPSLKVLVIGAQSFVNDTTKLTLKNATESNILIDDLMMWKEGSDSVDATLFDIARYGMAAFNENDERLLYYHDFETGGGNFLIQDYTGSSQGGVNTWFVATYPGYDIGDPSKSAIDTAARRKFVAVNVISDYGGTDVIPNAGLSPAPYDPTGQTAVNFSAPRYVYLDRYRNELGTDAAEIDQFSDRAFYRARCVGYTIQSGRNTDSVSTSELTFSQASTDDITVIWNWEIDYGGDIDLGTGTIDGLSDSDVSDDTAGLDWYGRREDVANLPTRFSSEVNASVEGKGLPVRFAVQSFVLENAPNSEERSLVLSPGEDFIYHEDIGFDFNDGITESARSFTVEFWARRDPTFDAPEDQTVLCIGSEVSGGKQIRVGFRTSEGDEPNAFFLANDTSGTDALAAFTDHAWHHWAAVNNAATGTVTLYRDGEVILMENRDFAFSGDSAMAIGATLNGTSPIRPFSGGVNNVRVWSTVRSAAELRESLGTVEYGEGIDGLEVELTFDDPKYAPTGGGLQLQTSQGGSPIASVSDIEASWSLVDTRLANQVKVELSGEYFGQIYRGQIQIDQEADYTFYLYADDAAVLWIDEDEVVNLDGGSFSGQLRTEVKHLAAGLHDIELRYMQGTGDSGLSLEYSAADVGIPRESIPSDILFEPEWPDPSLVVASTEGRGLSFVLKDYSAPFPTGIDPDEQLTTLFPGFVYMDDRDGVDKVHMTTSTGESSFDVTDWTAVHWMWHKEFLLVVQASTTDVATLAKVAPLPFISGDISQNVTIGSTSADGTLTVTTHEAWVREGAVVTVGTRFRSGDGCYQLADIVGQINIFSAITMDSVVDGSAPAGGVSREYTFNEGVTGPGTVSFRFGPTVYHAEIVIGEGLDVSTTAVVDGQLVPSLCGTNPVLAIPQAGPQVTASPQASTNGTPTGGSGSPYVWDYVGQTFCPLVPGEYTLVWPDANARGTAYTISINAQFPTDTVTIADRENEDGSRQGTAPDYEVDVTFPSVSDEFPASPVAHYRYVVSDGADTIPAALDPISADRWFFQRLAYSETTDAQVSQGSDIFTSTAAARSVLLYSYREDPSEVATGDTSKEALAVRVVNAVPAEEATVPSEDLSGVDALRCLVANPEVGLYGQTTGGGTTYSVGSDVPHSWQFSARLDEVDGSSDEGRIMLEVITEAAIDFTFETYQFGLRPLGHATNPGGFYFARKDYTSPFTELQALDLAEVAVDGDWHTWTIVMAGGVLTIHRDGAIIGSTDWVIPYVAGGGVHSYGYSRSEGGSWLHGRLDNLQIWNVALTGAQIRSTALSRKPTVNGSTEPAWAITFDGDSNVSGSAIDKSQGSADGGLDIVDASGTNATALDALEDQSEDSFPEVATRILSRLDTAGLDTGFLLNANSNYNPALYNRSATVGEWGPLYPVNWSGLYQADGTELHVAWYENPHQALPFSDSILHPNVAWPYVVADYDRVGFPEKGIHKGNRIYIASRLGSEGVDANGDDNQTVYDPAQFENLTVYNQPLRTQAGYNPNEEHALVAPSIKALLTGDGGFNFQQDAAFALQTALNRVGTQPASYTSEPWVLVQFEDLATGEAGMAAYKVEETRAGAAGQSFPLDILDADTHEPDPDLYAALTDPGYDFDYPIFAGDLLVPPYPVNVAVGSLTMAPNTGGNIEVVANKPQRTLWADKNLNAWAVSGDGRFFYRNWYPLNDSFWFDFDGDGTNEDPNGTPIAWLPEGATSSAADFLVAENGNDSPVPVTAYYSSFWRDTYPILKRGETVTYAGGENKAENPLEEGLPGIVGWASGEVVFDSRTPSMALSLVGADDAEDAGNYTARITRPLDRHEAEFEQSVFNEIENENGTLTPASPKRVMVVGARWHFKELTGSLQKRFYYDALFGKLVLRGRLNDLEEGDPHLTETPVALAILEANVLSADDFGALLDLGDSNGDWEEAVKAIYEAAQNPSGLEFTNNVPRPAGERSEPPVFWSGLETLEDDDETSVQPFDFWSEEADGLHRVGEASGDVKSLSSLGTGGALVPNPTLLSEATDGPLYVTAVENNHPDATGAVALHVIQIGAERFRGAIKVVEAQDVFDEKINLRHTGDFGGNTHDVYYEWWVRDTGALDTIGRPDNTSDGSWQLYAGGLGLDAIAFEGRPDISLADKFFYVRYGEQSEFANLNSVAESEWRLVDPNDPNDSYAKDTDSRVPYQWAGASNSPQLQADGSREFLPQLVMGWVKRVLDRVNPYEARFSDFANNDSPSVISSMLQQAGAPYVGDVALNSDKDVIEGVGLIELYETVLNRAKALTLDVDNPSEGTNQALLLAATRLAILYEVLGREAFTDANIPTVVVAPGSELAATAPFVFPFQNQVATAGHEELALLRGTDFLKAYPVYNRLIWNYVKGLGEAAYNANYAVWDVNVDGFINEFDAAELYPQGHGDAWGHLLSASKMHYTLLTAPGFDWQARSEFYSLLDNVIPADYLDEKSFARIAVAKARTGKEIVRGTYRQAYTADPDGQWQGYTDSADPSRAWGVSEWSHRAGQGAYFDWVVGNALVPEMAEDDSSSGLDKIDRQVNQKELGELAAAYVEIQTVLDDANSGSNPLGLDADAVSFDIDPFLDGRLWERSTHFEQIYQRAVGAGQNALHALQFANQAQQQLRRLNGDTIDLQRDAIKQDISFRNRLIEVFGTPYEGSIGPGQIYPEGYTGPDTLLYLYIDQVDPELVVPDSPLGSDSASTLRLVRLHGSLDDHRKSLDKLDFNSDISGTAGDFESTSFTKIFNELYLTDSPGSIDLEPFSPDDLSDLQIRVPVVETGSYAFQAGEDWGRRGAYGKIQTTLNEMLAAEVELEIALDSYNEYIAGLDILNERIGLQVDLIEGKQDVRKEFKKGQISMHTLLAVLKKITEELETRKKANERLSVTLAAYNPEVNGLDNDMTSFVRGTILLAGNGTSEFLESVIRLTGYVESGFDLGLEINELRYELDNERFEEYAEILNLLTEFAQEYKEESNQRNAIGLQVQRLHNLSLDFQSTLAEGLRLLDERETLNKFIASSAQSNRYQDMALRLTHNDAVAKYQNALDNAARYAWLAGKAYDYETALSPDDPASATSALEQIVKSRQLGLWVDGQPAMGKGGLAEALAQLRENFATLRGQLGLNNPDFEAGTLSLRYGHFRISQDASSDGRWQEALQGARVDDLWSVPEFRQFCRPFADPDDGPQPGIVIDFSTEITPGLNVFGRQLGGGDHAYSVSNFATKIASHAVWFQDYDPSAMSATPRAYLVPVGSDVMRISGGSGIETRSWNVVEQRIPAPFTINETDLNDIDFIPSIDTLDGSFAALRRTGDSLAFLGTRGVDPDPQTVLSDLGDSRHIGRSIWNTRWLLVIPGISLSADPDAGLDHFIESVTDIQLQFETYSHEGQ